MYNCIKVSPDGIFQELELDLSNYEDIISAIGSRGFEIVRTPILRRVFSDNVVMLVDDESAINGSKFNFYASMFYEGAIFGPVIFVCEEYEELMPLFNIEFVSSWFACTFGLTPFDECNTI